MALKSEVSFRCRQNLNRLLGAPWQYFYYIWVLVQSQVAWHSRLCIDENRK